MSRSAKRRKVHLRKNLRRFIRRGHPWVFDGALESDLKVGSAELVKVTDERGPFALAFADPSSPIRLRILDMNPSAEINEDWLLRRVQRAACRRSKDPRLANTDALRLIHGEADGIPGLVLDVYGGHGIALLDGPAAEKLWVPMIAAVRQGVRDAGFDLETLSLRRVGRERNWIGEGPPAEVQIREGEAVFSVDLHHGQKTGLFLDQRENRRIVGERSKGLRVLNLFGYTGGFSLAAALAGASSTCTVDIAGPAIKAARKNFELSGLEVDRHEFVTADVFDFLDEAVSAKRVFDLVVCDPPSFASSEKALKKGLAAYRKVNELALQVVAPNGIFCSASCSSHVTAEHLLGVVADASSALQRDLVVVEQHGAASDHPIRPGFPEGHYLSFLVGLVE